MSSIAVLPFTGLLLQRFSEDLLRAVLKGVAVATPVVQSGIAAGLEGLRAAKEPLLQSSRWLFAKVWQLFLVLVQHLTLLVTAVFEDVRRSLVEWRQQRISSASLRWSLAEVERSRHSMAVAAAAGAAVPLAVGLQRAFVVTKVVGAEVFDEFFALAAIPETSEWIVLTTADVPPHAFIYKILEARVGDVDAGGFLVLGRVDANRDLPLHARLPINFMCTPHNLAIWVPSADDMTAAVRQGQVYAQHIQAVRLRVEAAGGGGPGRDLDAGLARVMLRGVGAAGVAGGGFAALLPPLPPPLLPPPGIGGVAPAGPAMVGVGGGIGLGPGAALGLAAPAQAAGLDNMAVLNDVLAGLLSQQEKSKEKKSKKEKKGNKEKKEEKKSKSKKKKKKKKTKFLDESSTSSSSSSSDSDGSGSQDAERFMQVMCEKKRKFTADHLAKSNVLRFRKRSDLLNFAGKYPGALAGQFLHQVRMKSLGGAPAGNSSDLQKTDVSLWALTQSGLKDTRDQKEALFLSKVLLEVGHLRFAVAMDLCAQRLRELKLAKSDGGSWEKAAVVSMMPASLPSSAPVPDTAFVL